MRPAGVRRQLAACCTAGAANSMYLALRSRSIVLCSEQTTVSLQPACRVMHARTHARRRRCAAAANQMLASSCSKQLQPPCMLCYGSFPRWISLFCFYRARTHCIACSHARCASMTMTTPGRRPTCACGGSSVHACGPAWQWSPTGTRHARACIYVP